MDAWHKLLTGDRIGTLTSVTILRGVDLLAKTVVPFEMADTGPG